MKFQQVSQIKIQVKHMQQNCQYNLNFSSKQHWPLSEAFCTCTPQRIMQFFLYHIHVYIVGNGSFY